MRVSMKWCARALAIAGLACLASLPAPVRAQQSQHVVSLDQLHQDAARPVQTRQADEAAIRQLLSSDAGQKALKTSGTNLQKADGAISQLSDAEVARLAQRSREAQSEFAAGTLSDRDLLWIILIIVAVLIVALAVR
jgi:hypothetical protein